MLPRGFVFPGVDAVDLLTPLAKDEAAELAFRDVTIIRNVVGRLKPGVTRELANSDLMVIQSHLPLPPWTTSITIQMLAASRLSLRKREDRQPDTAGRGGIPAVDRLRQRQQSPAGAIDRARSRTGDPCRAGRLAGAA